jgi:glutamate formiminotransferase/formiminotetrahydrofolate cyclodeaminase
MSAALVAMVARLTIGKKKYAGIEAQMNEILNQAERLRRDLTSAVEEDAAAFEAIMAAFKLPKETPEQQVVRSAGIEKATLNAAQIPLVTAEKTVKVMALAERCTALGNLNAISDAGSAFSMGRAALTSAGYNVRINVNGLSDKTSGDTLLAKLAALEKTAAKLEADVRMSMQERGGLTPG